MGALKQEARPDAPGVEASVTVSDAPSPKEVTAWVSAILARALPPEQRQRQRQSPSPGLSVLLCGDARMRTLNRTWRGKDVPTDVLSFPSGTPDFLGDLAIDVRLAARQAREGGHPLERELKVLLVHGVLHLLGWDHEHAKDGGEMFREQRRVVRAVFGPGPDGVPVPEEAGLRRSQ